MDLETLVRQYGRASGRARDLSHAAGVRLARRSTREGAGAPRHQAGEHQRRPGGARVRLREGAGLRPGEGGEASQRRRHAPHRRGDDGRHADVHGAGARARRAIRRACRSLRVRLRHVLPADRAGRVRVGQRDAAHGEAHRGEAGCRRRGERTSRSRGRSTTRCWRAWRRIPPRGRRARRRCPMRWPPPRPTSSRGRRNRPRPGGIRARDPGAKPPSWHDGACEA